MIDLHYWTTPNGHKITIFLEEAGLAYRIIPVNISKGDQFKPEFLAVSPNNRIPGIVDHEPNGGGAVKLCGFTGSQSPKEKVSPRVRDPGFRRPSQANLFSGRNLTLTDLQGVRWSRCAGPSCSLSAPSSLR